MRGLAGHRIGNTVTTSKLAEALSRVQVSSVHYIGVAAARPALLDTKFSAWSWKKIAEGCECLASSLGEVNLRCTPLLVKFHFPSREDADVDVSGADE